MISKNNLKTQDIDSHLMDSLEKMQPTGNKQFFPVSKGKLKKQKIPRSKPTSPHFEPMPTSMLAPAPTPTVKTTSTPVHVKRYFLLFIPTLFLVFLIILALIAKTINTPLLPKELESGLYTITVILMALSYLALTLYYFGELRQRYVLSDSSAPVVTKDISTIAFGLLAWPLILLVLLATVFFVSIGDGMLLDTLGGLSLALLLTGPLTVTCGALLISILNSYKHGSGIPYPPYVHEVIDYTWRFFTR